MEKQKASNGKAKKIIASASYEEVNGIGIYDTKELERQDRENVIALENIDKRFALDPEYNGTNFAELFAEERELTFDPNNEVKFYPSRHKLTVTGKIIAYRNATKYIFRLDGVKTPFLMVGGEDVQITKNELPKNGFNCPSGAEILIAKEGKIACIIVKGAKAKLDYTFRASSKIWFGYIGKKEKATSIIDMG